MEGILRKAMTRKEKELRHMEYTKLIARINELAKKKKTTGLTT